MLCRIDFGTKRPIFQKERLKETFQKTDQKKNKQKKLMMEMVRKTVFFGKKHQVSEENKPETDDIVIEGYTSVFPI